MVTANARHAQPAQPARPRVQTDVFEPGARYDEVVVGAGLTGLVTALLFARAGRRVAVLDARPIGWRAGKLTAGAGADVSPGGDGGVTAFEPLTLSQGTQLHGIQSRTYSAVTRAFVDGNRAGQAWLLDYLASREVPVQSRDVVTFASTPEGVAAVLREYRLARRFGLDVRLKASVDLPFETFGAVVLPDQAQFDLRLALSALVADLRAIGSVVIDDVRVLSVRATAPVRVRTSLGEVFGDHVHLATGTPFTDRGLYFAKLVAKRYAGVVVRVDAARAERAEPPGSSSGVGAGALATSLMTAVDGVGRTLRLVGDGENDSDSDSDSDIVSGGGGAGGLLMSVGSVPSSAGRSADPQGDCDRLLEWVTSRFPGATGVGQWAEQGYQTPHRVPFVGWMPRGRRRIYFVAGVEQWGAATSVAAALTLATDLLGGTPEWARTLHRRVTLPTAVAAGAGANAATLWWALKGWASVLTAPAVDDLPLPAEGAGLVARSGFEPVGVSTVDGQTCQVSAICPHLGGVLGWNPAASTWDCPLHGSRFAADGTLIEGPSTRDLPR